MSTAALRRHPLGFLQLEHLPTPEELKRYYAERYYQNEAGNFRKIYPPDELEVIQLRIEQRAARALSLMARERPGTMLDVGCGEGFVLQFFDRLGWDVHGIDFSTAGVEMMNPGQAVHVEQGDVFELLEQCIRGGLRNDLVWLGNVLEHVLEPVALLATLKGLLTSDGVLVVTVPNDATVYHEELFATGAIPERFWIAAPDHISYFTAESLRRTAEATGWECLALQGDFPIDWFLAHEGSNYVADRSRGPAAHRARLQIERLIGRAGPDAANRFYASLAEVGFGRNLTAFLRPRSQEHE